MPLQLLDAYAQSYSVLDNLANMRQEKRPADALRLLDTLCAPLRTAGRLCTLLQQLDAPMAYWTIQ